MWYVVRFCMILELTFYVEAAPELLPSFQSHLVS